MLKRHLKNHLFVGNHSFHTVLFDYREFDEILMPAAMTRVEPGRREVFVISSVAFADVAESRFAPPERVRKLLKAADDDNGLRVD